MTKVEEAFVKFDEVAIVANSYSVSGENGKALVFDPRPGITAVGCRHRKPVELGKPVAGQQPEDAKAEASQEIGPLELSPDQTGATDEDRRSVLTQFESAESSEVDGDLDRKLIQFPVTNEPAIEGTQDAVSEIDDAAFPPDHADTQGREDVGTNLEEDDGCGKLADEAVM